MWIKKLKIYHLENLDLCIIDFRYQTKLRSDLKFKDNRHYDEHISYKTQKCKGIHSTVQAEIVEIYNLYPVDLEKCWGPLHAVCEVLIILIKKRPYVKNAHRASSS